MQQIHADGSVRHAEKRRNGSCQFANGIARISLDAYENVVPKSYRNINKQTCVAAVVAHITSPNSTNVSEGAGVKCSNNLQVMGLGVGTKFLSDAILREEQLRGTIVADGDGGKCLWFFEVSSLRRQSRTDMCCLFQVNVCKVTR